MHIKITDIEHVHYNIADHERVCYIIAPTLSWVSTVGGHFDSPTKPATAIPTDSSE